MAQQFEGKSVDEALTMAAEALGVERVQLTYHVVLEKRGFLGGFKRVVVEAEVNQPSPSGSVQAAVGASPSRQDGGAARSDRSRGRARNRGRGVRAGDGQEGGGRSLNTRGAGPRRSHDEFQTGDFERFAGEIPAQGPESDHAAVVRGWCVRVVELAGLQLEIRTEENDSQIVIRLFGQDSALLTDEHGELLDAIQVLSNKALVGNKVDKEIELNCEAFKERRAEQLAERARGLADAVRQNGREQLLPAMTPIERRIVHLALEEDADITTESRGDGFYKRIALVRRTKSSE